MNTVDNESEFTQPQDGLPCGGLSRSPGHTCLAGGIQTVQRGHEMTLCWTGRSLLPLKYLELLQKGGGDC